MPETLVSRSHASNAAQQIGIETNDATHRAHGWLFTIWPDVEEQNL